VTIHGPRAAAGRLCLGQLLGFVELEEIPQLVAQLAVARDGLGDCLAQQRIVRRHALDAGVVQAGGAGLAAEFAQFAQLVDHTHDILLVDVGASHPARSRPLDPRVGVVGRKSLRSANSSVASPRRGARTCRSRKIIGPA